MESLQRLVDLLLGVPNTDIELEREPGQDDHALGMLRRYLSEPASAKVPPKYLFLLFVDGPQREAGVAGRAHALRGLSKDIGLEPVRAPITIHSYEPGLRQLAEMTPNPVGPVPERRSKVSARSWTYCQRSRDGEAFGIGQNREQFLRCDVGLGRSTVGAIGGSSHVSRV